MSNDHIAIGPSYVSEAGKAHRIVWTLTTSARAVMDLTDKTLRFRIGTIGGAAILEAAPTGTDNGILDFTVRPATAGSYEYELDEIPAGDSPVPIPLLRGAWTVRAVIGAVAS